MISILNRSFPILVLFALVSCRDGVGPLPEREDPLRPESERVIDLAMAFQTQCALTADHKLHCWGENRFGEFGNGTRTPSGSPVLGGGGMEFVSVHGSIGTPHICGITQDRTGYCWGYNLNGELGGGSTADYEFRPILIAGGIRFKEISSSYHTCGLDLEGRAYCWGSGLGGQLGTGSDVAVNVPTPVASDASFTTITNGMQFSCALRQDRRAECWGWGVGLGSGEGDRSVNRPMPVSGALQFSDISAGEEHVCAVTRGGEAYCWGKLSPEWPGGFRGTPTRIPGSQRFVEVASGSRMFVHGTSCGLSAEGKAYCWHSGLEPLPVPGNYRFSGLIGGHQEFCGYTPGGAALCWRWIRQQVNGREQWVLSQPEPIPNLSAGG